jgi:hypothetical protein
VAVWQGKSVEDEDSKQQDGGTEPNGSERRGPDAGEQPETRPEEKVTKAERGGAHEGGRGELEVRGF